MPMNPHHGFLAGGGEMGERIRALDWSTTPLGPVDGWPQSLRSALSHLLPSKAQIAMFWGPESRDPLQRRVPSRPRWQAPRGARARPFAKYGTSSGRPGSRSCSTPCSERVRLSGRRTGPSSSSATVIPRRPTSTFRTIPCATSPGVSNGVFCIVSETTGRVVGERRLRLLRDLGGIAQRASSVSDVFTTAATVLARDPEDLPFVLFYARAQRRRTGDADGRQRRRGG